MPESQIEPCLADVLALGKLMPPLLLQMMHHQEIAVLQDVLDFFSGYGFFKMNGSCGAKCQGCDAGRVHFGLVVAMLPHAVTSISVIIDQDRIEWKMKQIAQMVSPIG